MIMDSKLSWKAKGILLYAFSRPVDWQFYKHEMISHASDGDKSFQSGIKELEKVGYLHRIRKNDKTTGQLKGWEWHFFEKPLSKEDFKNFLPQSRFTDNAETPILAKWHPTKNKR